MLLLEQPQILDGRVADSTIKVTMLHLCYPNEASRDNIRVKSKPNYIVFPFSALSSYRKFKEQQAISEILRDGQKDAQTDEPHTRMITKDLLV